MNDKLQKIQEINDIGVQAALLCDLAIYCNGKIPSASVREMRDIIVKLQRVPTMSDAYAIAKYTSEMLKLTVKLCETKDKRYIKQIKQADHMSSIASYALRFKLGLVGD